MIKALFVAILSLPLYAVESRYTYLDCGQSTQARMDIERQHLLLRVIPEVGVETLDDNLKWEKDDIQVINLDEYFFEGKKGYYRLERDTLNLRISSIYGVSGSYETKCFITTEIRIAAEINSIVNEKKAKQRI